MDNLMRGKKESMNSIKRNQLITRQGWKQDLKQTLKCVLFTTKLKMYYGSSISSFGHYAPALHCEISELPDMALKRPNSPDGAQYTVVWFWTQKEDRMLAENPWCG